MKHKYREKSIPLKMKTKMKTNKIKMENKNNLI